MRYVRFKHPKPLTGYLDERGRPLPGDEVPAEVGAQGFALSAAALEALARSKATRQPCELVVMGEEHHEPVEWQVKRQPNGPIVSYSAPARTYLVYGVTREYIEATTDYRDTDGVLHYRCPECEQERGQHRRGCALKGTS